MLRSTIAKALAQVAYIVDNGDEQIKTTVPDTDRPRAK